MAIFFLCGLLFALFLRVGKSVLYFLVDMPGFGSAIGFLGLFLIGPFLWLYTISITMNSGKSLNHVEYGHFIPGIIGFILMLARPKFGYNLYLLGNFTLITYVILSYVKFMADERMNRPQRIWNFTLSITIFLIGIIFIYQQLFPGTIMKYAIGVSVSSALILLPFFQFLRNPRILAKNISNSPIKMDTIRKVERYLIDEKYYLNASLTINQFSKETEIPSYKISRVVKQEFKKTFPEFINHLRIEEFKKRVKSDCNEFIKIEALAYDVGFKTPSAFYTAFKKETGMTPASYRKTVK